MVASSAFVLVATVLLAGYPASDAHDRLQGRIDSLRLDGRLTALEHRTRRGDIAGPAARAELESLRWQIQQAQRPPPPLPLPAQPPVTTPYRWVPPPPVLDPVDRLQAEIYQQQLRSRLNDLEFRMSRGDFDAQGLRDLREAQREVRRMDRLLGPGINPPVSPLPPPDRPPLFPMDRPPLFPMD